MSVDSPRIPRLLSVPDNIELLFKSEADIEGVTIAETTFTAQELDAHNISESVLLKIDFSGAETEKFSISDCDIKGCIFSASKFPDSNWMRVAVKSSRCAGIDVSGGILRNISFSDSKIEFVNFRNAKLEDVIFKDCMLEDVDFNNGNLKNVRFENCTLTDVTFNGAKMVNVDISDSTIEHIRGIESIRGVSVSQDQLLQLAPSLASAAGIKISAR